MPPSSTPGSPRRTSPAQTGRRRSAGCWPTRCKRLGSEYKAGAAYRASRIGPGGTLDEWRGAASDDEDAAHRLGQHLKTKYEQRAADYTPEDMVTLIRPDGEIVTVARVRELIERLTGWKTARRRPPRSKTSGALEPSRRPVYSTPRAPLPASQIGN